MAKKDKLSLKTPVTNGAPSDGHSGGGGLTQLLVVLGLTGFTITEPLLTIFGSNAGLFYFYNIDSVATIVGYACAVALLPALLLWSLSAGLGLISQRLGLALHYLMVTVLAALWLLQLCKWNLGLENPYVLVLLAILGGGLLTFSYIRLRVIGAWLQIAAVAPLVIVAVFLFASNTGSLLRHSAMDIARFDVSTKAAPVLFILLDEFPTLALLDEQGNLDEARYPNLASLSRQATWYRHYTTLADKTEFSLPSILTGNKPMPIAGTFTNFPNNLFTLLAPSHHLTVFETLTGLCGLPKCSHSSPGTVIEKPAPKFRAMFKKNADLWLQRISLSKVPQSKLDDFEEELTGTPESIKTALTQLLFGSGATNRSIGKPVRLTKFVDTFVAQPTSALYFLHLELPHIPWRFYENGGLYRLPEKRPALSFENDDGGPWLAKLSEYRFLLQAQYTDRLLGDVFDKMKALGLWDELLVVVSADHGFSFRLNTHFRIIEADNIDSITYAPLFIKRPGQNQGEIDDSNLMAFDLLPTMAEILGIQIPWQIDGWPAGHAEIAARGDHKIAYPQTYGGLFTDTNLAKKIEFSDANQFPRFSTRRIGSRKSAKDSLQLLNSELNIDQYIGRSPAEFQPVPGGPAVVDDLRDLLRPPQDKPPLGVVMGNVDFATEADKVLIAVNDRIVSGSPLFEFMGIDHTFIAMLPPGLIQAKNTIGVYLLQDEQLLELELTD